MKRNIGIIGCGNMGEALVKGLSRLRSRKKISLIASDIERSRRERLHKRYKVEVTADNKKVASDSQVIVIAVKPKDFDGILRQIRPVLSKDKILVSIAAGITTTHIEELVGGKIAVLRVMPNMPALIGEAALSLSAGRFVDKKAVRAARELFASIGDCIEVDEALADAVTAVSGSGPAYFFYLIECLIEAARELGLSEETAKRFVLKTALGSAKLLEALKEEPSILRGRVASKGGTTETAFKVFESRDFKGIVKEAVKRAYERSKELGKNVCNG